MSEVEKVLVEIDCGTAQAAKMLQVSVGTIHHMVERGDLQAWFTVGGHRRISLKSILNFQKIRRTNISSSSPHQLEELNVVVLSNVPETLAKLKSILESINEQQQQSITFFSNAIQMMLDLDSLSPRLIIIDTRSLPSLGGLSWFTHFRAKKNHTHTQILLIGELSEPNEADLLRAKKVDIISKPIDDSWLGGYVQSVATAWSIASQH